MNGQIDIVTTMDFFDDPAYAARARMARGVPIRSAGLWDDIKAFFSLLAEARHEKILLLDSVWGDRLYPGLLAVVLLGFWRRRPRIILIGDMWDPDTGLRGRLERLIVRLADRAVDRYIVQSRQEIAVFPRLWGIDPGKVRCCYYSPSLTERDLERPAPPPGRHIFAGGDPHRDYETLIEAARHLPDRPFVIATTRRLQVKTLPPNVQVGPVSHDEYIDLLRSAEAVVVALRSAVRRSAGQQTYLNAMWFGKPTIVTDAIGVRDFVADGVNGLVVDGTVEGYLKALRWISDPANVAEVSRLSAEAQRTAREDFSLSGIVRCIFAVVDELIPGCV